MKLTAYIGDRETAEALARQTALTFGGATVIEATGLWYDDNGELHDEDSYIVETFTDTAHGRQTFEDLAQTVLDGSDELSILVAKSPTSQWDSDHKFLERQT